MGQVFVFAFTAALNPTLLTGVTVMLTLDRPERLLIGFLAGALVTSVTCGLVLVFALPHSSTSSTAKHSVNPILNIALGGGLVGRVRRRDRTRPTATRLERAQTGALCGKPDPRWRRQLSKGSARDTFVVGSSGSPGASYIAGMDLLHKQNTGTVVTVLLVLAFNAIMLAPTRAPLTRLRVRTRVDRRHDRAFQQPADPSWRPVALIAGAIAGVLLILRGIVNW